MVWYGIVLYIVYGSGRCLLGTKRYEQHTQGFRWPSQQRRKKSRGALDERLWCRIWAFIKGVYYIILYYIILHIIIIIIIIIIIGVAADGGSII